MNVAVLQAMFADRTSFEMVEAPSRARSFYADFGLHRLTVAVRGRTIDDMRTDVARLGDELVATTVDL